MKSLIVNETYFNLLDGDMFVDIISNFSIRKDLIESDSKWANYLINYLILTYGKDKIPPLDIETFYTSRYFWIKLFYHYYQKECGIDVGIEQQIGMLIEEMSNTLIDSNYDWSILEQIDLKIRNEKYQNLMK
ncbi:hypothetical protein EZS27_013543 [termite gut metagenome]|uniref:Uncharacterized protein n=1 Tax=termite gut metagenome TaxID=433724 RepID=A0A5J4RXA9_9ZZZZ